MVGTMRNLVNEVLQSAVGNHFRNTLQALEAVKFIETRQRGAGGRVRGDHRATSASTRWRRKGVYIQDVVFPRGAGRGADPARDRQPGEGDLRGAAARRRRRASRWRRRRAPPTCRPQLAERAGGRADQDATRPRRARPRPRARRRTCELTGEAEADAGSRRSGSPRPRPPRRSASPAPPASRRRREALGEGPTALVAVANAVAEGHITVVPEVLVTGGGGGGPRRPRRDADALPLERRGPWERRGGGGGGAGGAGGSAGGGKGGEGNGASGGGSGGGGGSGSAAIDRPEGPETVPQVVREPSRDVDDTPIKE